MLHTIVLNNSEIVAPVVSVLEARELRSDSKTIVAFQSDNTIVVDGSKIETMQDLVSRVRSEYAPDSIFFLDRSYAVSDEKRTGDVILPNVFFHYDARLEDHEINAENRDSFAREPLFISQYDRQNDYDFESFGLSVGGIHVSGDREMDEDLRIKLRLAYEADTFGRNLYDFVRVGIAQWLDEKLFPIETIRTDSVEIEARNAVHIIRFFIDSMEWKDSWTSGETSDEWGE